MELRHLRYFAAVAKHLHFGKAALELHISQPPLSQQIRELEEELGAPLFIRNRRHVELSEVGRIFLVEAKGVLEQAAHATRIVQKASGGEVGRLVIGFVMSATCSVLPEILRGYRKRFPGVELTLHETTTGDGINALREKRMNFCFLRLPVREETLKSVTVHREQIILAVPKGHRLAETKGISLRSLADEDFILFPREDGPGFHDLILGICHQAGFSPRVVQVASQMQTILALVATGVGIALIPESVRTLRREGVKYHVLRDQAATTGLALAWHRDMKSPAMENFVEQCRSIV